MEKPLLTDLNIFPSDEILKSVLGNSFTVFETFRNTITGSGFDLVPEWSYYKDSKNWLCKVSYKKKTVFWLSAWDNFFKVSFFFTEKHLSGIAELNIPEEIKTNIATAKPIGKLLPLLISITEEYQLPDVFTLIEFKKKLK